MAAGQPTAGPLIIGLLGLPDTAGQAGSGSAAGRIVLVAIVVAAVGAFTVLQLMARSRRRRSPDALDWRTIPPSYDDSGRTGDDEPLFGDEPQWGYLSPPGYRGSPLPPWHAQQPRGSLPPG